MPDALMEAFDPGSLSPEPSQICTKLLLHLLIPRKHPKLKTFVCQENFYNIMEELKVSRHFQLVAKANTGRKIAF